MRSPRIRETKLRIWPGSKRKSPQRVLGMVQASQHGQ